MEENIKKTIDTWLNSSIDEADKTALKALVDSGNETELTDCFYKELEFGTGGLRGVMGLGSNRMNKYTVGSATQGLANYINAQFPNEEASIAIAHDSRNNSDVFAQIVADICSANGIKVYLFEALRPTPELSFAIRSLGCKSGIVVTASHNPKEYNGYKVYWEDGAQIIAPHDTKIIEEVRKITSFDQINFDANPALIEKTGKDIDEKYLTEMLKLSLSPEAIKNQSDLSIVFSPIHGTGITLVPQALERFGFTNVTIIEEQATPDGNFPTVVYPNPEEKEALTLALAKAKEIDAELVLATDPDADRVGIAIRTETGDFELLNGNQTGALLIYYLCLKWKANNKLDGKQYVVKTVVTTELIKDIATHFGVECFDTLTGFKHIAGLIKDLEGKKTFIGGGEESYGYLIGDFVRDKDAIASCAMIAEMAAWAKDNGKSLGDLLEEVYSQFGMYLEDLVSLTKKGKSGAEEIQEMMHQFRTNTPSTLAGSEIEWLIDYQNSTSTNLLTSQKEKIDFPSSNVLQFITKDGSKISMRPSGTEPKIKFYMSVRSDSDSDRSFEDEKLVLRAKTDKIKEELGLL
ncbi:phospho-sugar mutase [Reichenbachiella carrageenanivorans]|uniref:Phospho-sugar mutase n=1 Tax=Reichenbachiella carrageenanivorans TaxID=2979869 RepID=A0ABY6CZJ7_9BACT|nr:phospho-sugar mutase [Reichenbachiella carrageenanivorans]UXX79283.1 phospho-sugar mutase [Reichenbachiella carrageenanivorans]